MRYSYVAIEGNIGAGKTTLSNMFSERLNAKLVLEEFDENHFLPLFYKEPEKYAFQLELSFLAERYQQIQRELITRDLFHQHVLSDYLFHKCIIFAKNNLDTRSYELYRNLFQIIEKSLPRPDLVIYLHQNIETLQENIKKRGRVYEAEIPGKYLSDIQKEYLKFLKYYKHSPVLMVNTESLDFVKNEDDFEKIFDLLNGNYKKGKHVIEL